MNIMLGDASHGTREFYDIRLDITKRLVESGNVDLIILEADYFEVLPLNRYVLGKSKNALVGFKRFPQFMWKNQPIQDLADWLRSFNANHEDAQVQVFGIDIQTPKGKITSGLDRTVAQISQDCDQLNWNAREHAMFNIFQRIKQEHVSKSSHPKQTVFWMGLAHVLDARATGFGLAMGFVSLSELLSKNSKLFRVGFLTGSGYMTASSKWGSDAQMYRLPLFSKNSYESILNSIYKETTYISLVNNSKLPNKASIYLLGAVFHENDVDVKHKIDANIYEALDGIFFIPSTKAIWDNTTR